MKIATLVLATVLLCFSSRGGAVEAAKQVYGPVQPSESLYRIALKYRRKGVTVSQLMMSIFRNNPEAFVQNNINRLKVGVVLRIPDLEAALATDPGDALREATAQIQDYESAVRELRVERGELEPLAETTRDPDLAPSAKLPVSTTEVDLAEVRQELENEGESLGIVQELPEPKVKPRRKRREQKEPLFRYSYDVALVADDNVRLAQNDDDIREDNFFSGAVKATGARSLDSFSIWNYGARLGYNAFETFDQLDNVEIEVNTRYRFALSSGFSSPIYSLGAKLAGLEFESEMRDSTLLSLSAELNKWVTDTINMTAGLGIRERQSVSEVYDLSEVRIFINFDTNFSKRDLTYTTFAFISGDTVSSAEPTLAIINAADAIEPDDAFGGIDANQFAYRIDSDTVVITLGYNRILTSDLSLDLSVRFVDSESTRDDEIGYERTILRASLLGRF